MAPSAGALSRAVARMIATRATIAAVETPADGFVGIVLASPGFRGVTAAPGGKVQVAMGSVFETRTYTPTDWDAERGRVRILGFMHGQGPGAAWLRGAKPGDACDVLGPRHSLDLSKMEAPLVLFGDETSAGLALAVSRQVASSCSYRFEATDARALRRLIGPWNLHDVEVTARAANDAHLSVLAAEVSALSATGATFVMTGKAQTIQRLKAVLKAVGVPPSRMASKAYWAPGKVGLD